MKKQFLFFLPLSTLLLFTACQKEYSVELSGTVSAGSLQSDVSGDCLPKTVQGIYEAGTVLDPDSNYIDIQVNITDAGTYSISSDTINGMLFQANGAFSTTGVNNVRLKGTGTPLAAGINNFTIRYDTTECVVTITTLAQGGAVDAEFTLAGAPDTCMNYVLAGNYLAGIATTAANTVVINVNVTVPGIYNLATDLNNGITFSGSGSFTNTGQQTITLTATGTPGAVGSINIPVEFGTSSCMFTVDVTTAFDYFPRTAASNWSYQYDNDPNDSLQVRAKAGTVTLGGNAYTAFEATDDAAGGFFDYGNYRRAGSDYHTYADMGDYFEFDSAVNIDYIFLKDNVAAAATWQTDPINGTITDSTGIFPVSIRIAFTIEQKDVTITVGAANYNNTIVVIEKYQVFDGANWVDATEFIGYFKSYYARNVGLIKQDYYYEAGNVNPPVSYQQDIRRYQVY
ncbi:MAG TPA: hypothetical protein VJ111_03550 [Chitinophagaceae bacterium]|nr:hypothetical protein [Chitinophagaceae bacterium]